ncbi:MAG: hypothetical protein HY894_10195 [Deltaproteobacteria bacterium]|nr:hypothetical protein [Deltaproteobacteria bacterium]
MRNQEMTHDALDKPFERYPQERFYRARNGVFNSFAGEIDRKEIAERISPGGCVVTTGYQFADKLAGFDRGLRPRPVIVRPFASLYILDGFDQGAPGGRGTEEREMEP